MPSKKLLILVSLISFLTACGGTNNIEVTLSSEEEQALLDTIQTKEQEIESLKNEDQSYYLATVSIARAYEELGQIDDAIQVYVTFLDEADELSSAVHNNLGRLYVEIEEYDKAIEQYQAIVDTFQNHDYLKEISSVYLTAKNPQKAQEFYDVWKEETGQTDEFIQKRINRLLES